MAGGLPLHTNQKKQILQHKQSIDIGEIEFGMSTPIVKIATGRSHVLALDARGRVYSWGQNDKGQLGHNDTAVQDTPEKVKKLEKKDIVQIYCGEFTSFAVDQEGEIYAWGLNKNNCLLVNKQEQGMVKTIAKEPMPMNLPEYFKKNSRTNVVQNTNMGFDVYSAEKPVKSESSRTQEELEKVREDNAKLRKKVKDYQNKFQKINTGALQSFGGEGGGGGGKAGRNAGDDDGAGDYKTDNQQFEKLCQSDKVIQSIEKLIKQNKEQKLDLE